MIVDRINEYLSQEGKTINEAVRYEVEKLAGYSFKRQFMTENEGSSAGSLRLSSSGKCPRQLAYGYHGFEKKGKEIDSRSKIIFWTGDLMETMIVSLAKLAGCQMLATGLSQVTIGINVNGTVVTGHPDGVHLNGKLRLVEVKSMSSFAFKRFMDHGYIDDSYLAQINTYMAGLAVDECIFVGINKDSGVLHEKIVSFDPVIFDKAKKNLLTVLQSSKGNLPAAPGELDADPKTKFYPWNCLYCAYWGVCRPGAEKVLVKNSYKLKQGV